jgi:ribosomal-protein-alanine N-acetyltransferase
MDFPNSGIVTSRLVLHKARREDAAAIRQYYLANRENFKQSVPLRDDIFFTLESMQNRLADITSKMNAGTSLHLIISQQDTQQIIGECNFTNIVRSAFQACHLGFSIDKQFEGQGLMKEALIRALDFVFGSLMLHRVMANYRPENQRSGNLLKTLGFIQEGHARHYLKINGQWTDHILTSRINDSLT